MKLVPTVGSQNLENSRRARPYSAEAWGAAPESGLSLSHPFQGYPFLPEERPELRGLRTESKQPPAPVEIPFPME